VKGALVHRHPNVESKSKSSLLKVMTSIKRKVAYAVDNEHKKDTDPESSKRNPSKIRFEHSIQMAKSIDVPKERAHTQLNIPTFHPPIEK